MISPLARSMELALHLQDTVSPFLEHITSPETAPAIIFVCQRNAEPLGVALAALARHRDIALPPIAHERISKQIQPHILREWITEPLSQIQEISRETRVAVIDDYISPTAGTRHTMREALGLHGVHPANIDWLTLCGTAATLSLLPHQGPAAAVPWRDIGRLLGLEYTADRRVIPQPTPESRAFYTAIQNATPTDTYAC